ncbi:endonuclease-reverse transcriptase [Elysia marginata]|uniref:Endonuclease-reverse transcriptase n=1 Tax=Elysia marginata TaxID=1093978 RepID=A0AAV4ICN2_9GAST|nr:endonuclease-reverse transcriptase [Elysia marginata]
MARISWKEKKKNKEVLEEIGLKHTELLKTIKTRQLAYYGHIRRHQSLQKSIMEGKINGKRQRGRKRKSWLGNIEETTTRRINECCEVALNREEWRRTIAMRRNSGKGKVSVDPPAATDISGSSPRPGGAATTPQKEMKEVKNETMTKKPSDTGKAAGVTSKPSDQKSEGVLPVALNYVTLLAFMAATLLSSFTDCRTAILKTLRADDKSV